MTGRKISPGRLGYCNNFLSHATFILELVYLLKVYRLLLK